LDTDGSRFCERLIIFTRFPEPGKTKTRMIPKLGAAGATALQRQMTEHLVSRICNTVKTRALPLEIRFAGGNKNLMRQWLGSDFIYRPQGGGDIGLRMNRSFDDGFNNGCEIIVVIGSDIPEITGDIIQHAFEELKKNNLVLGPAADGGYYLIGLQRSAFKRATPRLFSGIDWGTNQVLAQTVAVAKKLGLRCILMETLEDVDRPEDLGVWQRTSSFCRTTDSSIRISIILPTLNEAENIGATLADLQKYRDAEIIVVDGGSQDDTVTIAKSAGVRVIRAAPSKAGQMNAGAAAATGDMLLFLHADTRLPDNFARHVRTAASQRQFCAGAFSLSIDSNAWGLRFIEKVANWRSRYLQMPYGDQALFVGRNMFDKIGGFPDFPIMEDFELIRRLRRRGQIILLPQPVHTSARRWLKFGIFKTWLLNQIVIVGYFLGISPRNLCRLYRREKGAGSRQNSV